jgi:hypothetical protein
MGPLSAVKILVVDDRHWVVSGMAAFIQSALGTGQRASVSS